MPCRMGSVQPSGTGARSPPACRVRWRKPASPTSVKGVEGAYARSDLLDLRRELMERWAAYLATGCR